LRALSFAGGSLFLLDI